MKRVFIEKYGLLIYTDGHGEMVSECTTFTSTDVTVLQFDTEVELIDYAVGNGIILTQPSYS